MSAPAAFAAADWGSSHLRLWLMDREGQVLAERRSPDGMLHANGRFSGVLEDHLAALDAAPTLPVFACGMVGARQGWVEAPYVAVPASLDAVFEAARRVEGTSRPVLILPGLSQGSPADVMRGEETQLAGLQAGGEPVTVCLPGTHSKWVEMDGAHVHRFATVPTGELFAVLGRHSILRHSLGGDEQPPVDPASTAFRKACGEALSDGTLVDRLFGIRASTLLEGTGAVDAAARLSGLLIGAEIFAMRRVFSGRLVLLASGPIAALYAAALEEAGVSFEQADADEAVRAGLVRAARHHRELWT